MSSDTVEPDACIVQLNYKTAMIDINSQLGGRDVESLKFLCSDFIPISKTEQFSTGLDIIMALQQMCLISEPDNVSFLAELLWLIGRVDLLRKLNTSMDIVKYSLAHSQLVHVSAYRYVSLQTFVTTTTTDSNRPNDRTFGEFSSFGKCVVGHMSLWKLNQFGQNMSNGWPVRKD